LAGTTKRSSCSPGQVIARKLVVDGAIVRHERPHPAGIQDVQRGDDAALIALLQDVGVAMYQLAGHPVRDELDAVAVSVWAPQNRGESCRFRFLPDTVGVLPHEAQPELRNIVRISVTQTKTALYVRTFSTRHSTFRCQAPTNGSLIIDHHPPRLSTGANAFCSAFSRPAKQFHLVLPLLALLRTFRRLSSRQDLQKAPLLAQLFLDLGQVSSVSRMRFKSERVPRRHFAWAWALADCEVVSRMRVHPTGLLVIRRSTKTI
jgi:hypothetical protein